MSILIAGVAGFLGSKLSEELLEKGKKVIGIDNLCSGKLDHIEKQLKNNNFKFLEFDISNLSEERNINCLNEVKEIYHLASPASPKFYQKNPFNTIDVNTKGTQSLLDLCLRNNAKMIYMSTSEIYGDPLVHPQSENYRGNVNTWGPRACYDEAKRLGEVYCYEYYKRYGVKIKVIRLFNTYSADMRNDDGRVITNFVNQALNGEDITVYGDGMQTRSFCYIDDTLKAMQMVMSSDKTTGEIVNIGNPIEYTILDLASIILELTNSKSKIVFESMPVDDPKVRRPDISFAQNLIDWSPEVSLVDGLRKTINKTTMRMYN